MSLNFHMYLSIFLDSPFCFPVLFIHVLITSCFNNRAFLAILVCLFFQMYFIANLSSFTKTKTLMVFLLRLHSIHRLIQEKWATPRDPFCIGFHMFWVAVCLLRLVESGPWVSLSVPASVPMLLSCPAQYRCLTTLPHPCCSFCNLPVDLLLPTYLWHSFSLYCLSAPAWDSSSPC